MRQQELLTSGLMFCAATMQFIWVKDLAGIVEYYSCPDNVGRMGDMQTFELPEERPASPGDYPLRLAPRSTAGGYQIGGGQAFSAVHLHRMVLVLNRKNQIRKPSPIRRCANVGSWHFSSCHQLKVSDHTVRRCPVRHVLCVQRRRYTFADIKVTQV